MTSLQSSPDIHQLTQTLHAEASKLNIKKHSAYIEAGLEEDNYLEILQELSDLDSCYVNKMESLWYFFIAFLPAFTMKLFVELGLLVL